MTDLTERTRLHQALIELDMDVHSKLRFDEVLRAALESYVKALDADAGDIKILSDGEWTVRYQFGFEPDLVGLTLSAEDAPIATRVMQSREPVVVEDYLAEPPEAYVGFPLNQGLRAVVAVPLNIRGAVVGCLFAWMRTSPRAFTPDELQFAERVADSVSLALENARLFTAEHDARNRAETAEKDLKRELDRTRVLLRASDELLTTTDTDELLRRLASVVREATGLSRVFINLIDVRARVLIPKVATGGLAAPEGGRIPFDQLSETSRLAISAGKTTILDYELPGIPAVDKEIAKANAARLVLFVPLLYQGTVTGHIAIDEPGVRYDFSPEQVRIVGSIAAQASIALHNAQQALERAVELLEQQLRWMAFSLHDGPVQTLSAAGAMLERSARSQQLDGMHALIAAAEGLLDHAQFEMREIMRELRPVELEEAESLGAKIALYAEAYEQQWGIPVRLSSVGRERLVGRHVQVSLFRVVQEALSNVRKHANATGVDIEIRFDADQVECRVKDDGKGFDIDATSGFSTASQWGLVGMRERVLMLGGTLEIISAPGKGTEIRACVPLGATGEGHDELTT